MKYIPAIVLFSYLGRTLYFGANLADSLILACMVGLYAFFMHLEDKKEPPINDEVKKQIENLRNEVGEVKSGLNSLKFVGQMRKK